MLGRQVRDKITGLEGIVTGKAEYITGCNQYCVAPKCKEDGVFQESKWFDEGRLEVIGDGIVAFEGIIP